ncbi:MAG: hypothetical protein IKS31_07600 [Clostridia bacterium]|nr:hypothetical protein [Clostridia bacterium]
MRKRWMLLCAAALLLLCLTAAGEESPNLLRNADFEQADDYGLPLDWFSSAYRQSEDYSAFFVDEDVAHSGRHSVCIVNNGPNDACFYQTVDVLPECLYRLSGWIMARDVVNAEGKYYDWGANLSIYPNLYVKTPALHETDGEWVYVEMYGETGPEQDFLTVAVRLGGYSGDAAGYAWFDDLSLTEVDELPEDIAAELWFDPYTVPYDDGYGPEDDGVSPYAGDDAGPDGTHGPAAPFTVWFVVIAVVYTAAAVAALRMLSRRTALTDAGETKLLFGKSSASLHPAVLPLLVLALAIRCLIALTVYGYDVDISCFTGWGSRMLSDGPVFFYNEFCDYPPGYLYVLGIGELLARLLGGSTGAHLMMLKLPPMLADLAIAWIIGRQASCRHGWRYGTLLCVLIALHPVTILNSAAWGQIDSVMTLLLLIVVVLASMDRKDPGNAGIADERWTLLMPLYMIAVLAKPQALMFGPLGLAAVIVSLIRDPGQWKDMLTGAVLALLTALVLVLPFSVLQSPTWIFGKYAETMSSYAYATVNCANLYYLLGKNWVSLSAPMTASAPLILAMIAVFNHRTAYYGAVKSEDRRWLVLLSLDIAGIFLFVALALKRLTAVLPVWLPPEAIGAALFVCIHVHRVFAYAPLLNDESRRVDAVTWTELFLMDLFTVFFLCLAAHSFTWELLNIPVILFALAVGIPMWLHRRDPRQLGLTGALILLILFICATKMHERYLFPGIVLLAFACAVNRDKRLCGLFLVLSATLFINIGIPLDNSIRLGRSYGHLNQDTDLLAKLISLTNLGAVFYGIRAARRVCVTENHAPGVPVRLGGMKS